MGLGTFIFGLLCLVLGIWLGALVAQPAVVLHRYRQIVRAWWRGISRRRGDRPWIASELRDLIRRMSLENPLWGAQRIHGELLKLGFQVSQSSVSRYMVPRRGRPTQSWATFLRNHVDGIAAIDMLAVPTVMFEWLYAFVVLGHGKRKILHTEVTAEPTRMAGPTAHRSLPMECGTALSRARQ